MKIHGLPCKFMVCQGKILGNIGSKNGISTDLDKFKVIKTCNDQKIRKDCKFLWAIVAIIGVSFTCTLQLQNPYMLYWLFFSGMTIYNVGFEMLKAALVSALILKAPDWNTSFHVHIDASNFAIGCILAQPNKNNMDFSISYASRTNWIWLRIITQQQNVRDWRWFMQSRSFAIIYWQTNLYSLLTIRLSFTLTQAMHHQMDCKMVCHYFRVWLYSGC